MRPGWQPGRFPRSKATHRHGAPEPHGYQSKMEAPLLALVQLLTQRRSWTPSERPRTEPVPTPRYSSVLFLRLCLRTVAYFESIRSGTRTAHPSSLQLQSPENLLHPRQTPFQLLGAATTPPHKPKKKPKGVGLSIQLFNRNHPLTVNNSI